MSNKKQSSVEWLKDQLEHFGNKHELTVSWTTVDELIEQAKEMHKEEIIITWHNGYENQSPMIDEDNCGQQYYKETYETNNKN